MSQRFKEWPVSREYQEVLPWDEWSDGAVWRVVKGVDYESDSLRSSLHYRASLIGKKVITRSAHHGEDGEVIIFQFVENTG